MDATLSHLSRYASHEASLHALLLRLPHVCAGLLVLGCAVLAAAGLLPLICCTSTNLAGLLAFCTIRYDTGLITVCLTLVLNCPP